MVLLPSPLSYARNKPLPYYLKFTSSDPTLTTEFPEDAFKVSLLQRAVLTALGVSGTHEVSTFIIDHSTTLQLIVTLTSSLLPHCLRTHSLQAPLDPMALIKEFILNPAPIPIGVADTKVTCYLATMQYPISHVPTSLFRYEYCCDQDRSLS